MSAMSSLAASFKTLKIKSDASKVLEASSFTFGFVPEKDVDAFLDEDERDETNLDRVSKNKSKKKKKKPSALLSTHNANAAPSQIDSQVMTESPNVQQSQASTPLPQLGITVIQQAVNDVISSTQTQSPHGALLNASSKKDNGKDKVKDKNGNEKTQEKEKRGDPISSTSKSTASHNKSSSGKGKSKGKSKGKPSKDDEDDEDWYSPQPPYVPPSAPSSKAGVNEALASSSGGLQVVSRRGPHLSSLEQQKRRFGSGKNLVAGCGKAKVRDPNWLPFPPGLDIPQVTAAAATRAPAGAVPMRPATTPVPLANATNPSPHLHSSPFSFGFL
jgi:hypothetical protein